MRLYSVFIILVLISASVIGMQNYSEDQFGLSIFGGFFGALLATIPLQELIYLYGGTKPLFFFKTLWATFRRYKIRISCAYLIKVECDGHILSLKSNHFNKYIAPGGVYKFYDKDKIRSLNLTTDKELPNTPGNDLRLRFISPINNFKIYPFLKWFKSKKGREVGPFREFFEELIDTKILDPNLFKVPNFEFDKEVETFKFSPHTQTYEVLVHNIYYLKLNDQQSEYLRNSIQNKKGQNYYWQTLNDISRGGNDQDGIVNGTNLEPLI